MGKEIIRIDKNGEEITKNISYILSNLVNNVSEGIHGIKCKFGDDAKKY